MRNSFEAQLELLNTELIKMGALCEDAIDAAAKALINGKEEVRASVRGIEVSIDQKERDIESLCLKLLLRQQPIASDLRAISSALKMISDLERIGDQAADIADITRYLQGKEILHAVPIERMAQVTISMVKSCVDAYVRRDLDLAKAVCEADDKVDGFFSEVRTDLIKILPTSTDPEACLDILMVAKYFERIGDHAVNVAEWVVFSITGQHE